MIFASRRWYCYIYCSMVSIGLLGLLSGMLSIAFVDFLSLNCPKSLLFCPNLRFFLDNHLSEFWLACFVKILFFGKEECYFWFLGFQLIHAVSLVIIVHLLKRCVLLFKAVSFFTLSSRRIMQIYFQIIFIKNSFFFKNSLAWS